MAVIRESLRVARDLAVFGFPSGGEAIEYDRKLADDYDRSRQDRPVWLREHILFRSPRETFSRISSASGW